MLSISPTPSPKLAVAGAVLVSRGEGGGAARTLLASGDLPTGMEVPPEAAAAAATAEPLLPRVLWSASGEGSLCLVAAAGGDCVAAVAAVTAAVEDDIDTSSVLTPVE